MKHSIHRLNILDITVLVLGGVEHAGGDELGAPGGLLLILDLLKKLSESVRLLLGLFICDDVDDLEGFLRKLGTGRVDVAELDAETLVSNLKLWPFKDLDVNHLLHLSLGEGKSILLVLVVDSCGGSVL